MQAVSATFFLVGSRQPLIERPDHRIGVCGDDGTHVEDGAHLDPATPHRPAAAQGAAIATQRRDAEQRCDLFVRQRA